MADTRNPVSSANFMGHPLHPILITLPIGLFVAVFLFVSPSGEPALQPPRPEGFGFWVPV